MNKLTVSSLELQLQKQIESARSALEDGRFEQALELCAIVLAAQPDCLAVRKLERTIQLRLAASRRGAVSKLVSTVSSAPFLLSGNLKLKDDPRDALATAEKLLRRNPQNVAALILLGRAATELGWSETALFAFEAASDLEPERPDLLVLLGHAYLSVGRPADSVEAAHQALRLEMNNPGAQTLLQNALVAAAAGDSRWKRTGDGR